MVSDTSDSSLSPDVVTSLRAKRVFAARALNSMALASAFGSSFFTLESRSPSTAAASLGSSGIASGSLLQAAGVDDVRLEARRRAAVAHRVALPGLALAVVECGAQGPLRGAAEQVERAPELERVGLVADVFERAGDLPLLHFVEHLPGELEVVALVVDRPAAVADHVDAVVGRGDELLHAQVLRAGLKAHVRHALKRHALVVLRVAAAAAVLLADPLRL